MKEYISPDIEVVRICHNVIATSTIYSGGDNDNESDFNNADAPYRRYRNGGYSERYNQDYTL